MPIHRRSFAAALAGASVSSLLAKPQTSQPTTAHQNANATPQNTSQPRREGLPEETPPFGETIRFAPNEVPAKVEFFAMTDVRLLPSAFLDAQNANLAYLKRLDPERLLYNFRVNAGLPSSVQPLGGWEAPDCELRGHFAGGHFLSACALMYSSTRDEEIRKKGEYMVAELAKCQARLQGGYLSAFPTSFFDRLYARQKVWAPFYTIHKIMAGMYDMHEHCGNAQALSVLENMAHWTDEWTEPIPEPHLQRILNTEFGGMSEVLYNLAAATGNWHYAEVGDRFTKKVFLNPLALRRDELRGLHANTHIPQVIGAARRYELSGDTRFHDASDFFWSEIVNARAYVTGGTSNAELWRVEPRRLAEELKKSADTTECCCAYNLLKLTRHLYGWTADPRYFDYYERTLYNHRLAAIDPRNGATQYYLSIVSGAWKTYNTEDDSFWCCTGTGVEEFSKLNNSIYARDENGLYVNLFIPSELHWRERGLTVRQETSFPDSNSTTLTVHTAQPQRMLLRLRIPYWTGDDASLEINRQPVEVSASPGGYLTIARTWRDGDRVSLKLPMRLHVERMPDDHTMQAFLYGPLVLAGQLGDTEEIAPLTTGHPGPDLKHHPMTVPAFRADGDLESWIKPVPGQPLAFRTSERAQNVTFIPFHRTFGQRYSVYWTVA